MGQPTLGRWLSVIFAVMCIGGSFGGGNMFQANQSYVQFAEVFPALGGTLGAVVFGLVLAIAVGVVIIGGIKRIGEVASRLVPFMCILYVICGLMILLMHASDLGTAALTIVRDAFTGEAATGGLVGVLIQGFRRAAFSNEAGCGSAPIVHSAAKTEEPVREGMVALLEPFVDTIIVCTTTGLVLVVTGAYQQPDISQIAMTSWAFSSVFPWFPPVLSFIAILFAFSTMISWSYYGEQCWVRLFGVKSLLLYQLIFLLFVWAGAVFEATPVINFGDMMILGMAFPNLIGVVALSGVVKRDLDTYMEKLRTGQFHRRQSIRSPS